jgi:hypothetical protein
VLEAVRTVAAQKGVNLLPSLAALYAHYHVTPVPEPVASATSTTTNPENELHTVQEFFKTNFDSIGIALLLKNKRDHLIELSEAVSQLEKPPLLTTTTEDKDKD